MQEAMNKAFEEKKQKRMDEMINRGAKIAKQQQEQVMEQLVNSTEKQKGGSATQKITRAVIESNEEVT